MTKSVMAEITDLKLGIIQRQQRLDTDQQRLNVLKQRLNALERWVELEGYSNETIEIEEREVGR
jgi:CII-binding regulator of phage lambda lysogenization HflD